MAKISTFSDGFATIDTALWTATGVGPVTATGGVLKVEYSTGAYSSSSLVSDNTYDLTDSAVLVQVADFGTRQTGWFAHFKVNGTGTDNYARMYVSDLYGVVAQVFNANTVVFSGTGVTFSDTVHKWMRIRETAGTLFFETATNGVNWTTQYSTASSVATWSMTTVTVELAAQRESVQATGGYSSFDNLNLPPATPQGNFFRFFDSYTNNIGGNPGSGPPAGGGGSAYIETLSDLTGVFTQNGYTVPAVESAYFQSISTSQGPGWQFSCSDINVTTWSSTNRAVLARKDPPSGPIGTTTDWTFDLYLPNQTLAGNWPAGVLWEFHTGTSSGHQLALNNDRTYRIARQSGSGQTYVYVGGGAGGPPIIWDAWVPIRFWVKWTTASDGFLRVYINGTQYVNFTGATVFAGEGQPYLQFGWYAERPSGVTNVARFANIQRTVT